MELDDLVDLLINSTVKLEFLIKVLLIGIVAYVIIYSVITFSHF